MMITIIMIVIVSIPNILLRICCISHAYKNIWETFSKISIPIYRPKSYKKAIFSPHTRPLNHVRLIINQRLRERPRTNPKSEIPNKRRARVSMPLMPLKCALNGKQNGHRALWGIPTHELALQHGVRSAWGYGEGLSQWWHKSRYSSCPAPSPGLKSGQGDG